ncbi:MAG: hypothetical protein LBD58_02995 [Treponema sp.]|jgi:hypothetical protein|nr:hypothetical protein [Treponema sp.]
MDNCSSAAGNPDASGYAQIFRSGIILDDMMAMRLIRSAWGDSGAIYDDDLIFPSVYIEDKNELSEKSGYCFDVF